MPVITVPAASLLVVDDNEMNREMLTRRLQRQGYGVLCAKDGVEAIALLRREPVDLVLLDVMMPGLSGIEVLKIVRKTRSIAELPIIMTTALDSSADIVQALEHGANDYVTKPLDFPVVLARIQAQLQVRRLAAAPPAAPPAAGGVGPGSVIAGKYRLDELIGAGAAGQVYRATHLTLGHAVAIKILTTTATTTPAERARFQHEGVAACRVKHPNAVTVVDFGIAPEGITYLVMELLEGYSLADELATRGRLPLARCVEILGPVCAALSEAHRQGIVHRDLKPANIFLQQTREAEVVKVVDFGIAKILGDDGAANEQHLTLAGHVLGTPAYMAPERLLNRPYDGAADVYSLGILLFRLLTGQLPFEAPDADPLKVALLQIQEPPPLPRLIEPTIPPAVEALILSALAKAPAARPTPAELATRLAAAARAPSYIPPPLG